jgi:hypothetical protein
VVQRLVLVPFSIAALPSLMLIVPLQNQAPAQTRKSLFPILSFVGQRIDVFF